MTRKNKKYSLTISTITAKCKQGLYAVLWVGDFHVFDQGHQSLSLGLLLPCYHALYLGARPRSNTAAVTTAAYVSGAKRHM